jgi:hypothetical protein
MDRQIPAPNRFKLNYENQYVAFIDILGFSELILEDTEISKEQITECVNIVTDAKQTIGGTGIKIVFVSDSIVLSVPQTDHDFTYLCLVVALIQKNLCEKQLLTRGAISIGSAHINEDSFEIFGPAYIQAYNLEQQANAPRVIIDPRITEHRKLTRSELISKTVANTTPGIQQQTLPELLTSSESQETRTNYLHPDHFLFINFLEFILDEVDAQKTEKYYDFLKRGLNSPQRWASKYQWLKDYTMASIHSMHKRDPNRANVLYHGFKRL